MNMEKEWKEMRSYCPRLTRIENLTQGLIARKHPEDMFLVRELEGKGRGVFLKAPILPKDSFVLEYEGDIISAAEAEIRDQFYSSNGEGCFIMYFKFKDMKLAVDATRKFDSYGRLVNHSIHPNIRFHKPLVIDLNTGMPRIAAYALRDIKKGEEIVMDYGVRDGDIPWLKNSESGFLDVDADPDFADDSSEHSSTASEKMPCNLSFMKASRSEATACNNFNKIQKVDGISDICTVDAKKKRKPEIVGFCLKNFLPDGRKRSYFVAYKSINEPEEIIRLLDEPCKKVKKPESHNEVSVISCRKKLDEMFNNTMDVEKNRSDVFSNGTDEGKENVVLSLNPEPTIESNLPQQRSCISLNETVVGKFLMDSKIEKLRDVLCELSNLAVAEGALLDKTLNWTTESDTANDICRSLKTDCDVHLPEVAGACIQSGLLPISLRSSAKSLSASPQVAVIKPYNPVCLVDKLPSQEDDIMEGVEKVSTSITESERKYLQEIFQSYQGLDKVHSDEVEKIVKKNKDFLVKMLSRGITKDQITSTIRQFFEKTSRVK